MTEPTITCPNCKTEIPLTASLAAPLIEATKRDFEARLRQKDQDVAKKEQALKDREDKLAAGQQQLEAELASRLKSERARIAEAEAKKARALMQNDLEQNAQQLKELKEVLVERDRKLAEAQKAQAELVRKQRELDDAKREMALTIEKKVEEGLTAVRDKAKKEAEESLALKVREKEQTIASMQKQIEELKRRAEQGSQQLQGEVQELVLEELLKAKFPLDEIAPVPKGEFGGDVTQSVRGPAGQPCGTILWESKSTKNWSDSWLPKLREDQRAARADVAVIVSRALPKGVESFDLVDDVWVVHARLVPPVSMMLRQGLIEAALARQSADGLHTKAEHMYQYLTGPKFRHRIQAIVEAFQTMQDDLDKERKVIMKQWDKRAAQIERVTQGTLGMYGDLQGIAGKTLQEIEGLELKALEDDSTRAIEGDE